MKNRILLASSLFLTITLPSCIFTAPDKPKDPKKDDKSKTERSANVTKSDSLKVGDKLNLSQYTKTNDGIQFKIIKKASGKKPLRGQKAEVNYRGYLLKGTNEVGFEFDNSFKRNQSFSFKVGAGQVIPGWDIMVADMNVGETRIVILPASKAYGARATSTIPANSSLIFEIELISIV